jgi:hypothetical protein
MFICDCSVAYGPGCNAPYPRRSNNGLGHHIKFLGPERAVFSIELLRITEFVLIVSTVFIKISVSLFLNRLLYVSLSVLV